MTSGTFPMNGPHASILNNANNVHINGATFSINVHATNTLNELFQRVAPNAVTNEGGRADNPKCHPGTREEVIQLIERKTDSTARDRILWLSGPAGAGKSAIMKTIVERSSNRNVHTISFFFFGGDATRNGVQPVIPTLLYQLFELYPPTRGAVENILAAQPRKLDGTFAQQCTLISALFPMIRDSQESSGASIILLIDGLDECDNKAERSQADILHALERLVMEDGSPFRLLVASRPDAHIQMAFNQLSSHAQTIYLNKEYAPEKDIRLFVAAEFEKIKASHPSAHSLPSNWPAPADIDAIVRKSSGQFMYAATVMRYIALRATVVPSLSLERVKGIIPSSANSPFTHLDSIYIYILSRVDNPSATRAVLSMGLLQKRLIYDAGRSLHEFLHLYNPSYSQAVIDACVSELSALVELSTGGRTLKFYHASFVDFLVDKARSGTHWIDRNAFTANVLIRLWDHPILDPGIRVNHSLQTMLFMHLETPTPEITHRLLNLAFPDWTAVNYTTDHATNDTQTLCMHAMKKLYYSGKNSDIYVYTRILERFIRMLVSRYNFQFRPDHGDIPFAAAYFSQHEKKRWWQKLIE